MLTRSEKHISIMQVFYSLVFCLLAPYSAIAADPDYEIEIVILEDISGKYSKSENWPIIPEEVATENTKQTRSKSAESEKRIKILSSDSFKLDDEIKRIEESNEYRVLLHTAWRQSGLDKPAAFPVRLATKNQPDNEEKSYIEGDVTLVLSRYLHISGDLTFYRSEKGGFVPYPVKFDRRMRSRETHYIDHPMVSVLVLTTPISR